MTISPRDTKTKQRILAAASVQFERFGPRKTSMDEIARTAKLSRATLYLHFNGKAQIYESLLRQVTNGFVEKVLQLVVSNQPAPRKFRQYVELTNRTYSSDPVFAAALSQDTDFSLADVAGPVISEYRHQILNAIRAILEQGIKEKEFRVIDTISTAFLLYELGTNILVKGVSGQLDTSIKNLLDTMDDLVARGILNH